MGTIAGRTSSCPRTPILLQDSSGASYVLDNPHPAPSRFSGPFVSKLRLTPLPSSDTVRMGLSLRVKLNLLRLILLLVVLAIVASLVLVRVSSWR